MNQTGNQDMNRTTQTGLHPDAESLSAFAEQAVAPEERTTILKHLAECGRCRQVVSLAQLAAADAEASAALQVAEMKPARLAGLPFTGWRLVWLPAAALAAIVLLVAVIQLRQPRSGPEVAKVEPQATPQAMVAVPPPAPPPVEEKKLDSKQAIELHPAKESHAGQLQEEAKRPSPALGEVGTFSSNAELRAQAGSEHYEAAAPAPAAPPQVAAGQANFEPEPKAAPMQQEQLKVASTAQTVSVVADSPEMAKVEVPLQQRTISAIEVQPMSVWSGAGSMGLYKAQVAPLPSGLTPVSAATAGQRRLAIDPVGTLYLSEDSGAHWQEIGRQWDSRAVEVRIESAGTSGAAASGAINAASAVPSPLFELVNDRNNIWVSTDGKTWKPK
jgi:hypothetical protein